MVLGEPDLSFVGRHGDLPAKPTTQEVAAIAERLKEMRRELDGYEVILKARHRDASLGMDKREARSALDKLSDARSAIARIRQGDDRRPDRLEQGGWLALAVRADTAPTVESGLVETPAPDYLSITPQGVAACSRLADETPLQSPVPERRLYPDHILWKVGDATFKRPLGEPLLDFLVDHLKYTFGQKWSEPQYSLPVEERHVVMQWWFSLCELRKASAGPNHRRGRWFKVAPSGDAMEFMSIADDLYRLRLGNVLLPRLVNRLRNRAEFQGARYECAIGASFVRCGFDIAWQRGPGKKCEFVATHRATGESIAVEVKSRRRPGTLNEPGGPLDRDSLRLDVGHLYEQALRQCPADKPCGVFIDVNLPPESAADESQIPWREDLQAMLDDFPEPGPTTPATETCLVFTNFGWHYTGKDRAQGNRYVLTFPQYVRRRLTNLNTFVAIVRAIQTYGEFPVVE